MIVTVPVESSDESTSVITPVAATHVESPSPAAQNVVSPDFPS